MKHHMIIILEAAMNLLLKLQMKIYLKLDRRTVYAIAEYLELSHPRHYIMDNSNAIVNGENTIYNVGLDFYSDDFAVLETNADRYIM